MANLNLTTIIASATTLLGIFILNLTVGMYYGFGFRRYWFFQTLHFLGGFFVAMFLSSFFQSAGLILAGLGIVTVLWESMELLIAKIPAISGYTKRKFRLKSVTPELKDTVFDIILNFSGAILFLYFF